MTEETDAGAARQDDRERPLTDEERARLFHDQVKRLHTLDLVRATLADMVTLAYQKLGLTAETADLRDLGDVRVGIETVRRLVEVLESEGAADEARTYRSTLAALQLQFVAAASAASSGEGPPVAAPAAPAAPPDEPATADPEPGVPTGSAGKKPASTRKPSTREPSTRKPSTRKPSTAGKPSSHTKKSPGKKASGRADAPESQES